VAVRRFKRDGRWRWQARVMVDGRRLSQTRDTRKAARDAEAELRQQLRESLIVEQTARTRPATLREAFALYLLQLEARGKGAETITRAEQVVAVLQAVLPEPLDRPVTAFGEADILAFRGARERKGIKPATINRDLRVLRALLRRAVPGFRFPEGAFYLEDETRVRFLTPDDESRLFVALPPPFRQIARLAVLTLMRLSEVRFLRRDDVHLNQGVVLLPRTGPRPVVLNQEAQAILREQLGGHASAWVFPKPDGRPWSRIHISSVFRDASRAIGLRDFRFHDLRHHGATMALNAGFTAPIVMALGGWKSERMMRRYAAVTDETLRRAAEAVAGNGHGMVRNGVARVNRHE
jgi:integrase